jgi:hypothetical protein
MAVDNSRQVIEQTRRNALATMAEVTAEKKPDYYVGGKRYDWAEYLEVLRRTVDWCDRKLSEYEDGRVEESIVVLE